MRGLVARINVFLLVLRIYFVTYNVATKFPDLQQDLHQLLDIPSCDESKPWPDLYFIGYVRVYFSLFISFHLILVRSRWFSVFLIFNTF